MADDDVVRETKVDRNMMEAQWQKQQIKSFTAWVNTHLLKVGNPIDDLTTGFKDGLQLIKLVEVISNDKLRKPEKGKMRLHHIQNVNIALDAIAARGVKLVGISAEEIVDGNLKLILGMIWMLILRFQIEDISVEEMSAKEGLLLWCQRKTAGYNGCNVQNFHTSWQDGNAFCALINKHRPDLLDYDALEGADARTKLQTAFDVAEKNLQIPQMLDVEDMVGFRPDERSVMTYVAAYYHAFAGMGKAEEAARRVEAVLLMDKEFQQMTAEYETRASNLLEWIAEKRAIMGDSTPLGALPAAQAALQEYRGYKKTEKPPKSEERAQLEAHYATLQTKLRLNNRPAYHPVEGMLISDINVEWKGLEQDEKKREAFLRSEIDRLERMEQVLRRFNAKAGFHDRWAKAVFPTATSTDYGTDLPSVQALQRQLKAFSAEVQAHSARPQQLRALADQLAKDRYDQMSEVSARVAQIDGEYEEITQALEGRRQKLDEAFALQERLDNLKLEFATQAQTFSSWAEAAQEDLMDPVVVRTSAALKDAQRNHDAFKASLPGKEKEVDKMMESAQELSDAGVTDMVYTQHTPDSVYAMWNEIQALTASRDEQLEKEQAKQQGRDELRKEFAQVANSLGAQLEQKTQAIRERNLDGTLESQLSDMQRMQAEVHEIDASPMHEVGARCDASNIVDNSYTNYTVEELDIMLEQLNNLCTKTINTIENQILMRDQSGISEEKMKEYKESFDFFDKNKSGQLDKLEFRACLLSTGYDLPDVKGNQKDPAMDEIMAIVDPDQTGYVTYEAFVDFLGRNKQDSTSSSQFLQNLRTLAGDKDYITEEEVRRELSPEAAEFVMRNIKPYPGEDGAYDYKSLAEAVFSA